MLERLPLGTYNVVAGRDFCGPHSFVEETYVDVELTEDNRDVEGIDFTLGPVP